MNYPIPDFIVHAENDNVGVVVVEEVVAGQSLQGWIMANDQSLTITANDPIPIGHKIAITHLKAGDDAVKYGENIGKMTQNANDGDHIHTQNLKTKRW